MSHQQLSQAIFNHKKELATTIIVQQRGSHPQPEDEYIWEKCLQDTDYNLDFLSQTIATSSPQIFANYIGWLYSVLESRQVPVKDIEDNLLITLEILCQKFPQSDHQTIITDYIQAGLTELRHTQMPIHSFIDETAPYGPLAQKYITTILNNERHQASQLILKTVHEGVPVKDIYLYIFQPVQHEIGRLWQLNKISVAQEHYATAVTQLVMSQLYPYIFEVKRNAHKLIATCVGGELHEIGIRMVADFFEMAGWDTFYLGANTPTSSIIHMVQEREADVLAISSTLMIHIKHVEEIIQAVRNSNVKDVKILVGGHPFNLAPDLWQILRADGYAPNADIAIEKANQLVQ